MFLINKNACSICGKRIERKDIYYYPNCVCHECDEKAVDSRGILASKLYDQYKYSVLDKSPFSFKEKLIEYKGPNPVYINGIKCWRRYTIGGWVTMVDKYNSRNYQEFEKNNFQIYD